MDWKVLGAATQRKLRNLRLQAYAGYFGSEKGKLQIMSSNKVRVTLVFGGSVRLGCVSYRKGFGKTF